MSSNRPAAIFDVDGVLVDSYRLHFETWQRTAAARGIPLTEAQFAATFGQTNAQVISYLTGGKVTEEEIAAWGDEKEAMYRDLLRRQFPAMPCGVELATALHAAGWAIGIGSSGPPENLAAFRECWAASSLVDAWVSGEDVHHGKPDPEVFLLCAERLGVAPARCVVVEDSIAGLTAARRGGMVPVALTGTAPRDQLEAHAGLVVHSLCDLSPSRLGALLRG
ncbi:MAG: HAD family phosphatase [Bacteroidetes bacterium]|nr:HAD family phosphatase [Bacteroidota bacterium]MCL5025979.1 HAD family phosphatase [Chloroflexota bacterium]